MATYYMNADVSKYTIITDHSHPSEYQDLIDEYLARGGKITKCREGARTTFDDIKSYTFAERESETTIDNCRKGSTTFDQASYNKFKENNTTVEDLFDNLEKF